MHILLAGADNFGFEQGKGGKAVEWMNSYAKKNDLKLDVRIAGHILQTIKFGNFELIAWNGDWSSARKVIRKVSAKLTGKALESGYHEKRGLLSAMLGASTEYAKVYSSGDLIGRIELDKHHGQWTAKSESFA